MTTTAQDRDVNKPCPCSRRTRWRPFWRCWQTVSISTYFDLFKTVLIIPAIFLMFFFVVVSFQAQLNLRTVNTRNISCHGLEFQTAVSRFLHSLFSELRLNLKKQNDLLYKSNVVPDYFLLVEDFPSMFKFIYRSWLLALLFVLREFNSHTISRRNCEILKERQQSKLTETCKRLCLPNKCLWRQNVCFIKQFLQSSGFITVHTLGLASRRL